MFVIMVMVRPEGLAGAIHIAKVRLLRIAKPAPQGAPAE